MKDKINKSAILHIPMSEYAFGTDEEHIVIRLRSAHDSLDRCILYYGDRACRQTPVIFSEAVMDCIEQTILYDYWQIRLEKPYTRICYYFKLFKDDEEILYYGDQFCKSTVDDRSEYYQLPYNHRADIVKLPSWVHDACVYNIFPDSFASGERSISCSSCEKKVGESVVKGKLGGTIEGIRVNIPYYKELGINTIYLNPIFTAGEYHKYDLIDYYHIDPCFGTDEQFKKLVDELHEQGMKIIINGVFNHCGWNFFAFKDVIAKGENSKYRDWFYRLSFPVIVPQTGEEYPTYECFGYERMMPKLDTANPDVRDCFCRVGRYWVENYQIDGWRLDVASEVDNRFWRQFYDTVKAVNRDVLIIGEVWETARHWLDGTIFDSAMNYDFRKHCRRFFAEQSIDAREFHLRVTDMLYRYREQTVFGQLNLLDSHDVSRFLSLCQEDRKRYMLSILFLMTFPGIPSVFYGDEQGIHGIYEEEYRHPMIWENGDKELFRFFKHMICIRKKYRVLRYGWYKGYPVKENSHVYIYERYNDSERIIVCINMSSQNMLPKKRLNNLEVVDQSDKQTCIEPFGYKIWREVKD